MKISKVRIAEGAIATAAFVLLWAASAILITGAALFWTLTIVADLLDRFTGPARRVG